MGDGGGETKGEILVFEFGEGEEFLVGVGKIERDSIGDVAGVEIRATKKPTFY